MWLHVRVLRQPGYVYVSFVSWGRRTVAAISNGATNYVFVVLNMCVCGCGQLKSSLFLFCVNSFVNPFEKQFYE